MKKIIIVGLVLLLSACISSEIESYTDPDYKDVKFGRIIVDLSLLSDASRIEASKEIFKRLRESKYEVIDLTQILPPTRNYTAESAREIIKNSGYDHVLRFVVTSDTSKSEFAGMLNNTNSYASFNGNSIYGNSQSLSIPLKAYAGQTTTTAYVYDAKEFKTAWQANISTKASGKVFVGNVASIASSVIGKVIDQWKLDGH